MKPEFTIPDTSNARGIWLGRSGVWLALATLLMGGCQAPTPTATRFTERIGPFSEAEFDEYAGRVAERLSTRLSQEGFRLPVEINAPRAFAQDVETLREARELAGALVDGINDRMRGSVRIVRNPNRPMRLTSAVRIEPSPDEAARRDVIFSVTDEHSTQNVVAFSMDIPARRATLAAPVPSAESAGAAAAGPELPAPTETEPASEPRARGEAVLAPPEIQREAPERRRPALVAEQADPPEDSEAPADEPLPEELDMDDDPAILAARCRRLPDPYRGLTLLTPTGLLIFLDEKTRERFGVHVVRSTRTSDDRMRVEVDVRSLGRKHDAQLRYLFLDDAGRVVGATDVLDYEFVPTDETPVVVIASDPRATAFIVLLQRD